MKAVKFAIVGLGLFLAVLAGSDAAEPDGSAALVSARAYLDDGLRTTVLTLHDGTVPGFAEVLGALDLHGLDVGAHTVWLETLDSRGHWSDPLGQSFHLPESVAAGAGAAQRVTTAEVFVDTDPGEGAATPFAAPEDGAFGQPVETLVQALRLQGLAAGPHTLYVRVRDGHGRWSPPSGQNLYLSDYAVGAPGPGGNRITGAEVFFDTDPGPGHGRPLTATADGGLGGLSEALRDSTWLAGLSAGVHTAYVRVRNGAGAWSRTLGLTVVAPGTTGTDGDRDGVPDANDNCPTTPNSDQANHDTDAAGDACDSDDDNDGVPDAEDAFPLDPTEQSDRDGDGTGDNADPDDDGDGVPDLSDNCPLVTNPGQSNHDSDTLGDACDSDDDNDGVPDGADNCPLTANADQADTDHDGIGDACDFNPNAWLAPATQSVRIGSAFTLDLRLDSRGSKVGAYSLRLTFDPARLRVDTTLGEQGVDRGDAGIPTNIVNTDNASGVIQITGFDVNGSGPGADLQFLVVHLVARDLAGATDIGLQVATLADPTGQSIGTGALGARVLVTDTLCGDANTDRQVNIIDALWIARQVAGLAPTPFDALGADVTGDGAVTIIDALMIARHVAGLAISGGCLAPAQSAAPTLMQEALTLTAAGTSSGTVTLTPSAVTTESQTGVLIAVRVDSGSARVGAYTLEFTFDPARLQIDTTAGTDQGVNPGPDGLSTNVVNVNNALGRLVVTGFDITGKGPGANLHLLDIHLRTTAAVGSAPLTLTVRTLADPLGQTIGTPGAQGAVITVSDNCPLLVNPDQTDTDHDGQGDACDTDDDNDGVPDDQDAFPLDPSEQRDSDGDGIGDNADPDDDNDGIADVLDNCPLTANPDQQDSDGDTVGDACEQRLYVNAAVTGGSGDGSSWTNAFASLADALAAAQTGDDLWVAGGLYYPDRHGGADTDDPADSFEVPAGVQVWGGFAGTETTLVERDWYRHPTVLSGDIGQDDDAADGNRITGRASQIRGTNSAHVVHTGAVDAHTLIDGFVITGGDAAGGNGGGWLNAGGTPVLRHLHFQGNRADLGGAIHSTGALVLTDSAFSGNAAMRGGALDLAGGDTTGTNLSLGGNGASDTGGAIYVESGAVRFVNSVLWGNTPNAVAFDAGAAPTLATSLVQGSGGALWNRSAGTDGGGNRDADPLFRDLAHGDLRPGTPASPLLDVGSNAAAAGSERDLGGTARIQQGTVDLGAWEQTLSAAASVTGSGGSDAVIAQRTNTSVLAGAGNDVVFSALGRQVITLGPGRDLLVWGAYPDSDVVNDFSIGEDRLDPRPVLRALGYTGTDPLGAGRLFCTAATGGAYLMLDRDGPGGEAASTYALVKGPGLTPATLCTPANFDF